MFFSNEAKQKYSDLYGGLLGFHEQTVSRIPDGTLKSHPNWPIETIITFLKLIPVLLPVLAPVGFLLIGHICSFKAKTEKKDTRDFHPVELSPPF